MKAYRFDILIVADKITGETKLGELLDNLAEHPSCIIALDYKEIELKEKYKKLLEETK